MQKIIVLKNGIKVKAEAKDFKGFVNRLKGDDSDGLVWLTTGEEDNPEELIRISEIECIVNPKTLDNDY